MPLGHIFPGLLDGSPAGEFCASPWRETAAWIIITQRNKVWISSLKVTYSSFKGQAVAGTVSSSVIKSLLILFSSSWTAALGGNWAGAWQGPVGQDIGLCIDKEPV